MANITESIEDRQAHSSSDIAASPLRYEQFEALIGAACAFVIEPCCDARVHDLKSEHIRAALETMHPAFGSLSTKMIAYLFRLVIISQRQDLSASAINVATEVSPLCFEPVCEDVDSVPSAERPTSQRFLVRRPIDPVNLYFALLANAAGLMPGITDKAVAYARERWAAAQMAIDGPALGDVPPLCVECKGTRLVRTNEGRSVGCGMCGSIW